MRNIGWLDFVSNNNIETRSENGNDAFIKAFSSSNTNVTESDIMEIPTVQAIIEIIGGTIAQLPIYLYKEDDDGSIERLFGDDREFLLNNEPNQYESSFNMKRNIVKDYLIHGCHRIYKECRRNTIIGLYSLPTQNTSIDKYYKNGFILSNYSIKVQGEGGAVNLKPTDIISILKDSQDGVTSKGALSNGKKIFSMIKKEIECQSNIYENGAMPLGVLETDSRLTDKTIDTLRNSWTSLYSGSKNIAKTVILEEGLKYRPVSLNPKDLMLTESKREHISEICRLFNIPESLINSQANKYGSLEQNNIAFLQYTLSPIITAIEDALNKSLLLEDEKYSNYFWAFDTSEVLKTTEKEKYEALQVSLNSGIITINEARAKINKKPIKDDVMKWSLGSVLYNPENGNMMIPNMGIGMDNSNINQDSNKSSDSKEDISKESLENNKVPKEDTQENSNKGNINKGE